jgi:hypothetical protein
MYIGVCNRISNEKFGTLSGPQPIDFSPIRRNWIGVSFFRHEEARAPLLASGADGGGRIASSIMHDIF